MIQQNMDAELVAASKAKNPSDARVYLQQAQMYKEELDTVKANLQHHIAEAGGMSKLNPTDQELVELFYDRANDTQSTYNNLIIEINNLKNKATPLRMNSKQAMNLI